MCGLKSQVFNLDVPLYQMTLKLCYEYSPTIFSDGSLKYFKMLFKSTFEVCFWGSEKHLFTQWRSCLCVSGYVKCYCLISLCHQVTKTFHFSPPCFQHLFIYSHHHGWISLLRDSGADYVGPRLSPQYMSGYLFL